MSVALYNKSMNRSLRVVFTIRPKAPSGSFFWLGKDGYLSVISKKENKLNSWDFNNCRTFLECMIREKPDNAELVKAYIKLIEKKTKFDIACSSHNADVQKNWENSQKEQSKNWQDKQAEVTKESIKHGTGLPRQY